MNCKSVRRAQMETAKIRTMLKLTVVLSYALIFISVVIMPHFEKAEPNPYFQFNNLPTTYWLGISASIVSLLLGLFSRKEAYSYRALGLSSLFSLSIYTNVIPRLMYKNEIYLDLYPYVAEVAHILFYGHAGEYRAAITPVGFRLPDTPGPSFFASQFALVTGLNYSVTTVIISFLFSILIVIGVYLFAQTLVEWRAALVSVLVYIGFNQFGFYYCRGDFSSILIPFAGYGIMKLFITRKRSWYTVMSLFYFVLVLSHPAYSLFVVVTMVAPILLIKGGGYFFKLINRRDYQENLRNTHLDKLQLNRNVITCFLIWGSWFLIYTYSNLFVSRVRTRFTILSYNPTGIISPAQYTSQYYPIVLLSFYDLLAICFMGFSFALFYVFRKKTDWKIVTISSWLIGLLFLIGGLFVFKMSSYTSSLFKICFPLLGVLIGKFFTENFSNVKKKTSVTITKYALFGIIFSFIVVLPLTEYSFMAFVYPSGAYLGEVDYLTMRARGSAAIIGGHEEFSYYILVNNASARFMYGELGKSHLLMTNISMLSGYNIIAVVYRAYAKDGYDLYQPPMWQLVQQLQGRLVIDADLRFARIYDADSWDFAYAKQQ
jgi:hypothetical protein